MFFSCRRLHVVDPREISLYAARNLYDRSRIDPLINNHTVFASPFHRRRENKTCVVGTVE